MNVAIIFLLFQVSFLSMGKLCNSGMFTGATLTAVYNQVTVSSKLSFILNNQKKNQEILNIGHPYFNKQLNTH